MMMSDDNDVVIDITSSLSISELLSDDILLRAKILHRENNHVQKSIKCVYTYFVYNSDKIIIINLNCSFYSSLSNGNRIMSLP